jgi:hypothetical protein
MLRRPLILAWVMVEVSDGERCGMK